MNNKMLFEEAAALAPQLVEWRRTLHRNPEIGMHLPKTSAYVQEQLKEMGVPYKLLCGGACVVGLLGDESAEKCIMLRGDMDALPMAEASGEAFASENGYMHACGHDIHTTVMLGIANVLKAHEAALQGKGCVKLLFQPAEETFEGAKAAIADGVLENPHVDAAYGVHVGNNLPVGTFMYGEVPTSGVYGFKITLTGLGAHGSSPELGIDPIIPASHLVLALEELISREVAAADEAVLTVCKLVSGSAANIIPNTAELQGTLRTFRPEVEAHLVARIGEVTENIAKAFRVKADITQLSRVPSLLCNQDMAAKFTALMPTLEAGITVLKGAHVMASEDFATVSRAVPTLFVNLGCDTADGKPCFFPHNPKVRFNEACMPYGVAAGTAFAIDWLNNK